MPAPKFQKSKHPKQPAKTPDYLDYFMLKLCNFKIGFFSGKAVTVVSENPRGKKCLHKSSSSNSIGTGQNSTKSL